MQDKETGEEGAARERESEKAREQENRKRDRKFNARVACCAFIAPEFHSGCNCNQRGVILAICRRDI